MIPAPASVPVVTASSPQDLLVLAAHTLGFWPHDSLVLVALHGPRRRSGLVLRADLAALLAGRAGPAGRDATLDDLLAALAVGDAHGLVALVCDDVAAPAPEHLDLLDALEPVAQRHGLDLVEAVLTSASRRWSLTCGGPCCPPEGVALDLAASPVAVAAVLAGSAPAGSREALVERATAALAPAPAAQRAAVADALAVGGAADPDGALCVAAWWAALSADPCATPGPAVVARLLRGVADLLVRDAMMVSLLPTGASLLGLQGGIPPAGRAALAAAVERALARACAGDHPGDDDLDDAAVVLLSRLCALAPPSCRPGVLALLAHVHWWRARPVHAEAVAALALEADPEHPLAGLVAALVAACAPPDWVRRPVAPTAPARSPRGRSAQRAGGGPRRRG